MKKKRWFHLDLAKLTQRAYDLRREGLFNEAQGLFGYIESLLELWSVHQRRGFVSSAMDTGSAEESKKEDSGECAAENQSIGG